MSAAPTVRKRAPVRTALQKITVALPTEELERALRISGKGLTETLHAALVEYRHLWACRQLLAMRGATNITDEELRAMTGKDDD